MKELLFNGRIVESPVHINDVVAVLEQYEKDGQPRLRPACIRGHISQFQNGEITVLPMDSPETITCIESNCLILLSSRSNVMDAKFMAAFESKDTVKQYLTAHSPSIAKTFAGAPPVSRKVRGYNIPEGTTLMDALIKRRGEVFTPPYAKQDARVTAGNGQIKLMIDGKMMVKPFKVNNSVRTPGEYYILCEDIERDTEGRVIRGAKVHKYDLNKALEEAIIKLFKAWMMTR